MTMMRITTFLGCNSYHLFFHFNPILPGRPNKRSYWCPIIFFKGKKQGLIAEMDAEAPIHRLHDHHALLQPDVQGFWKASQGWKEKRADSLSLCMLRVLGEILLWSCLSFIFSNFASVFTLRLPYTFYVKQMAFSLTRSCVHVKQTTISLTCSTFVEPFL